MVHEQIDRAEIHPLVATIDIDDYLVLDVLISIAVVG